MSKSTLKTSVILKAVAAIDLPILLLGLGLPVASAQCSQATRPEPASKDQTVASLPGNPAVAAGGESSSSSEPANGVRFATGSAITVLEDTPLQVITDVPISSRTTKPGARLSFAVTRDVVVDGILVIPCGATVYGAVAAAKQAGRLVGSSNLTLQLTALDLDGRSYPLYAPPFKVVGQSRTRPTLNKMAIGASVGAVAMDARIAQVNPRLTKPVTGGQRAFADGVAAGLGAGVGTAIAASSPPSIALIPAESQLEFNLASPVAVFPVDQRTAARLARGVYPGGPVLYLRGESQ